MGSHEDVMLNVLLIEPHRTVAEALTTLVSDLGIARIAGTTSTPSEAFEFCRKMCPDVALVDLDLTPDFSLIDSLMAHCPDLRILVLAERTPDGRHRVMKAMSAGALGAIYKESSFEDLGHAILSGKPTFPEDATEPLLETYISALAEKRRREIAMIEALASAVEVRDLCTGQHLQRVTQLAQSCLEEADRALAMNPDIRYGFMLHDVGKIGVPDAILNKPGALDRSEWRVMQRHPEMGAEIVGPVGLSERATQIIMCHHERWDGSGYPKGLSGVDIPVAARAFSVADAYDAMTTDRPYRNAMTKADALQIIKIEAGRSFDPEMVDVLVKVAMSEQSDRTDRRPVIDLT